MKRISMAFLLLLLFILPENISFSQDDSIILDIRKKFYQINNAISQYRKVDVELEEDDPGSLTGYFHGSALRKIVYQTGDNMHTELAEYYFWNNQLFFAFVKIETTPVPGNDWKDSEDRFYFHGGRLYRWLDTSKKSVPRSDARYDAREKQLLDTAREYRNRFR
jgi:hypothetical protein